MIIRLNKNKRKYKKNGKNREKHNKTEITSYKKQEKTGKKLK